MSKEKINTTIGLCTIALTKNIMKKLELPQDAAYRKLLSTELYRLLTDDGTGLYLETNQFLCQCCDAELDCGADAMYEMIKVA